MFEWKDDYSIHIKLSDAEHRKLFRIGEELHEALIAASGKTALVRVLRRLARLTGVHFSHEEGLLLRHGYPDLAAHKAQHAALVRQIRKLGDDLEADRTTLTVDFLLRLKDWLESHIRNSDRRYVPYLKSEPVSQLAPA